MCIFEHKKGVKTRSRISGASPANTATLPGPPALRGDKDTPGDRREVRCNCHKESEASGLRAATAGPPQKCGARQLSSNSIFRRSRITIGALYTPFSSTWNDLQDGTRITSIGVLWRESYGCYTKVAQNCQLQQPRRKFEEGNEILPCEAKSFPSTMGHENSIFTIAWRKLFTKFKSFSSLYIPHNLIHNTNLSIAPKRGASKAPPSTP